MSPYMGRQGTYREVYKKNVIISDGQTIHRAFSRVTLFNHHNSLLQKRDLKILARIEVS